MVYSLLLNELYLNYVALIVFQHYWYFQRIHQNFSGFSKRILNITYLFRLPSGDPA